MPPRKLILWFVIRLALIFGLLIGPWPGWNKLYGRGFCAAGNAIFARNTGQRVVYFAAHRPAQGLDAFDSEIVLARRDEIDAAGHGPVTMLGLDTRSVGWVPTALTIALILAAPGPWRRQAGALVAGLFLIHAFIAFSVATYISDESSRLSFIVLSPVGQRFADALEYILIYQMGVSFSVPVLIWILVSVHPLNWART